MKLAYCVRAIFPQHGFGGLERAGVALMRHLLVEGVDIGLFTQPLPPGRPIVPPSDARGHLTVHPVRYGRLPLPPTRIAARLTNYRAFVEEIGKRARLMAYKGQIQGIYAQGMCAWGVRDANLWGVPMVANPQGLEEFKTPDPLKRLAYAPFRAWVKAGCRAADRVIATDAAMQDEVGTLLGLPPEKIVVIPNGVDVGEIRGMLDERVQADLLKRWPALASDDSVLKGISVGRMEANKGFAHLLRALAEVKASPGEDWAWFFVGDGSLRNQLEALSLELGMGKQIVFTGSLSDAELHNLYALCNLFAHPTLYEGSSLVTLEAMCHALPVVASATGGIPDKIIEGETGFLVRPGDEAQLARRILWMAEHPQERRQFGGRGALLAEQRFGWRTIAAQTADLFAQLVSERAACQPLEAAPPRC